jgi:hypothetical protein
MNEQQARLDIVVVPHPVNGHADLGHAPSWMTCLGRYAWCQT